MLGVAAIWVAADWPVGALGAGYLLSMHQLQFVLFVMIAPPLLWLGTPTPVLRRLLVEGPVPGFARFVTRPVPAIVISNAIIVLTHLPEIVDGVMETQLGSFAVDIAWMGAGGLLWWPVISRLSELNPLSYPARFGYLLVATLVPGIISAFYFFADYPIYRLYEFAPPVGLLPTIDDQFVGGAIMKFGGFVVIVVALTTIWFRWHGAQAREERIVLPPVR